MRNFRPRSKNSRNIVIHNQWNRLKINANVLALIAFLLCATLIVRLGQLQIVQGDTLAEQAQQSSEQRVVHSTPRGKMIDRHGRTMVTNRSELAVTYTRYKGVSQKELLEDAKKLASILSVPTNTLTEDDKKDYWMMLHPNETTKKLTKEEAKQVELNKLTNKEAHKLQLSRVTNEEAASLTENDLEVYAVYKSMNQGYALTPQFIKNKDVSAEEYTMATEKLSHLPGVDITADWVREYPYDGMLRSVIGKVSSSSEGLPRDKAQEYLAQGYSRNDRVGTSYLEEQYESLLQGTKEIERIQTDSGHNVVESEVIQKGSRGRDLMLTIDLDLQTAVEQAIEDELKIGLPSMGPYADRAFVTMMDPHTGEILSMAGKQAVKENNTITFQDFSLGNVSTSYAMGSAVKGATILTGLQTGAIKPGETFDDAPVKLKGTPSKSSWRRYGVMDETTALQVSSNIYMFQTAMKLANFQYYYDAPFGNVPEAFDTFRYYFQQFGLGVPTGIKLPNETAGVKGKETKGGLLLDLSIGQYDTYTPLQLAQYISTIANDGKRMEPQLMQYAGRWNEVDQQFDKLDVTGEPNLMNKIDIEQQYIDRVKEGFRKVMQEPNGTAYSSFHDATYKPAGKTGTAQTFYSYKNEQGDWVHEPTYNLTLVGYAPADNPQIAFSIVVPWVSNDKYPITKQIGRRALDAYFAVESVAKPRLKDGEKPQQQQQQILDQP
ncbi:peptidoglycan D,D-transpeptidase FtsI family protein [Bacillus luti]